MARKKRRPGAAERRPAEPKPAAPSSSDSAEKPGQPNRLAFWLAPAAGLALVASWLAALGALAAGDLEARDIFEFDTLRPWLMFADMTGGQFPVTGWRQGVTYFWIPDVVVLLPLFATGLDFRAAMLLFPLLQVALCAAGWILVCDALYGKNPARRAAVLLLHALTFLVLAWRGADIFYLQMSAVYHYGTWATVPWLLWLSLRFIKEPPRRAARDDSIPWGAAAALMILLALTVASDLLIVMWFIVPAGASAAVMLARGKLPARGTILLLGILAAGYVLGKLLSDLQPFPPNRNTEAFTSFNPEKTALALSGMLENFALVARRNPLETLLWLVFAAVGAWRGLTVMLGNPRRAKGDGRSFWREALGVPEGRGHSFAALFVPAAALAPILGVAATGNIIEPLESFWRLGMNRYFAPLYFVALFVGWALLPWRGVGEKLRAAAGLGRIPAGAGVGAAAALAVLLSLPQAARIDAAGLDPFDTPFQRCFAENAQRLGWRAGIATAPFALHLRANPSAGIERMLLAVNFAPFARGAGEAALLVDWLQINRHWFAGDFDFAALNDFNGKIFRDPPGLGHSGCAHAERRECASPVEEGFFLGAEDVRRALGEPAEIVECEGVGFLHYDPPLSFNFGELKNPDLKVIGRRW